MKILGIDPGTFTGYAIFDTVHDSILDYGSWLLTDKDDKSKGNMFNTLDWLLCDLSNKHALDLVAYEDVRFRQISIAAIRVYAGSLAIIQRYAVLHGIPYLGVWITTSKKLATGKGNANKEQMIRAAKNLLAIEDNISADTADAIWIAKTAAELIQYPEEVKRCESRNLEKLEVKP